MATAPSAQAGRIDGSFGVCAVAWVHFALAGDVRAERSHVSAVRADQIDEAGELEMAILRRGGFALMNCGSSLFRDRGEVSPCLAHAKPNRPISFRLCGLGAAGADLCVLDILFGL